ncbi:Csu type fimbrial protein [Candidatus Venteria ishoeyi]|uniref:Spore Coat Protein U domain protein n=1 Tax=Candidatus Venteria ishoeyi TaxID=1899563 RepID=A0A1H6F4C9_9GAMM|nr:spore coat protein U domain-containing protein [Candidatus Venteria ishoeyi]SEH05018.1 Spore Coat Protein U domain protein [Candidatus Venteria ishoeyi]
MQMIIKTIYAGSLLVGSLLLYLPIHACEITVYPVQFGTYSGAELYARGEVIIENCPSSPVIIKLNAGNNSGGTFISRYMGDGLGNKISYNLYLDAGHNIIWGDGIQGNDMLQAGEGRYMIYAQVPAYQFMVVGKYRDRVEVLVEW